jgi:hypothetical protein
MHIKEAVEWVLSKARTRVLWKETPTRHPGSKKRRHDKKLKAAQKRAKQSRKRNRRRK